MNSLDLTLQQQKLWRLSSFQWYDECHYTVITIIDYISQLFRSSSSSTSQSTNPRHMILVDAIRKQYNILNEKYSLNNDNVLFSTLESSQSLISASQRQLYHKIYQYSQKSLYLFLISLRLSKDYEECFHLLLQQLTCFSLDDIELLTTEDIQLILKSSLSQADSSSLNRCLIEPLEDEWNQLNVKIQNNFNFYQNSQLDELIYKKYHEIHELTRRLKDLELISSNQGTQQLRQLSASTIQNEIKTIEDSCYIIADTTRDIRLDKSLIALANEQCNFFLHIEKFNDELTKTVNDYISELKKSSPTQLSTSLNQIDYDYQHIEKLQYDATFDKSFNGLNDEFTTFLKQRHYELFFNKSSSAMSADSIKGNANKDPVKDWIHQLSQSKNKLSDEIVNVIENEHNDMVVNYVHNSRNRTAYVLRQSR